MYINCPGGSVIAGLAIYDVMKLIRSEVVTINIGMSASMASFLLAAGKPGKRLALPHSRVMIHQPMGGSQGQAEDIRVEANQILRFISLCRNLFFPFYLKKEEEGKKEKKKTEKKTILIIIFVLHIHKIYIFFFYTSTFISLYIFIYTCT